MGPGIVEIPPYARLGEIASPAVRWVRLAPVLKILNWMPRSDAQSRGISVIPRPRRWSGLPSLSPSLGPSFLSFSLTARLRSFPRPACLAFSGTPWRTPKIKAVDSMLLGAISPEIRQLREARGPFPM